MTSKIHSAIPLGFDGQIIEVEGDQNRGLPAFNIVGMANKTVSEAKERVRSAIKSSGFSFPSYKLTISLAPAELHKDGAYLDLPIALSVLALSGQLIARDLQGRLFVGELALDGTLRPVRGIINIIEAARSAGFREIYIPLANLPQAALFEGTTSHSNTSVRPEITSQIYGVDSLKSLYLALKHQSTLPAASDRPHTALSAQNALAGHFEPSQGHFQASELPSRPTKTTPKTTNTTPKTTDTTPKPTKTTPRLAKPTSKPTPNPSQSPDSPLLDHIRGQELAKRALAVAIAGHHNLLISGPPGAGKTLLARTAANLLPALTPDESLALTKIYSLAGPATPEVIQRRPFRHPHHSASPISIIGGGVQATPGEISLAHQGILFLDEIPEFPRSVLEALRQPLEDKQITISRAHRKVVYPADFMLIATMNPCPCGYLGDPSHECRCTEVQIQNYQKKLSGPLFDRIDMCITVAKVENSDLLSPPPTSINEHTVVKNTITEAIARQTTRYGAPGFFNSNLSSFQVSQNLRLSPAATQLLASAAEKLQLSARAYFKTIKVAQTIADLAGTPNIEADHLTEALTYRHR